MKPYYDHNGITIYHGDCREIVASVVADALITDPPYGVNFKSKANKRTKPKGGFIWTDDPTVGPQVVALALKHVSRGLVFTGTRALFDYPRPDDIGGVYCQAGGLGRWGFSCYHITAFYGAGLISNGMKPTTLKSSAKPDDVDHSCPKPMEWMRWAVQLASLPGEIVLDPFCGSGTTLRAAKDLGRKAIGIEIEERYCEIAVERLRQEVFEWQLHHLSGDARQGISVNQTQIENWEKSQGDNP